jgi:hypothetical protein
VVFLCPFGGALFFSFPGNPQMPVKVGHSPKQKRKRNQKGKKWWMEGGKNGGSKKSTKTQNALFSVPGPRFCFYHVLGRLSERGEVKDVIKN